MIFNKLSIYNTVAENRISDKKNFVYNTNQIIVSCVKKSYYSRVVTTFFMTIFISYFVNF